MIQNDILQKMHYIQDDYIIGKILHRNTID